jgi:hypothetical protein
LIVTTGYDGVSGVSSNQTWIGQWTITPPATPAPKPPPAPVNGPYLGKAFAVNQIIEAENYDKGGEGIAYHDTTAGNLGGTTYRAGDGVDVQAGGSNGYHIGYTAAGEWLTYTITIATAGKYQLQASVSNVAAGGTFHASFSNGVASSPLAVANTGSWQKYQTVTSGAFTLPAGQIVMKIYLDKNSANGAVGNFDWFKLVAAGS